MPQNCAISEESLLDCLNLPVAGVDKYVFLYNLPDWAAMVAAGNVVRDPDGTITGITNTLGVQAYRYDVPDSSALLLGYPDRKVDGGIDGYDHMINFSIINNLQSQKNTISVMRFTNVVAVILKKNGRGEVYGEDQGLEIQTNTGNPADPAIGSVIPIELKTSPRDPAESSPPPDVFDTDVATTSALILGLNVAGV